MCELVTEKIGGYGKNAVTKIQNERFSYRGGNFLCGKCGNQIVDCGSWLPAGAGALVEKR